MKKFKLFSITAICAILCVIIASSCGSAKPTIKGNYSVTKSTTTNTPYDEVWNNVIDFFAENNIPIVTLEKESGIIVASDVLIEDPLSSFENEDGNISNSLAWFVSPYTKGIQSTKVTCNFNVRVRQNNDGTVYISVNIANIKGQAHIRKFEAVCLCYIDYTPIIESISTGQFEKMLLNLFK